MILNQARFGNLFRVNNFKGTPPRMPALPFSNLVQNCMDQA
jgi:hypothetical protein